MSAPLRPFLNKPTYHSEKIGAPGQSKKSDWYTDPTPLERRRLNLAVVAALKDSQPGDDPAVFCIRLQVKRFAKGEVRDYVEAETLEVGGQICGTFSLAGLFQFIHENIDVA